LRTLKPGDAWYEDLLAIALRAEDKLGHIYVKLSSGSEVRLVRDIQYFQRSREIVHIKVAPKELQTLFGAECVGISYSVVNCATSHEKRVYTQHKPWYRKTSK